MGLDLFIGLVESLLKGPTVLSLIAEADVVGGSDLNDLGLTVLARPLIRDGTCTLVVVRSLDYRLEELALSVLPASSSHDCVVGCALDLHVHLATGKPAIIQLQ